MPAAPGEFAIGSAIAGYRLEERIGAGGMAAVFRAYDARLDRQVALKILAPALALDDAFRRRFIRESHAAAAVDDPHIIPVFQAGEARGVLFIAMRLVRGGDVRSLLDREGQLSAGRATEIISQVAAALDAAHARGLVHRDVKPANMLLDASAEHDGPGHVYLSDFGLSKTALAASRLTGTGQFLGTLDYVAPEQIEGRRVDGRTDQYSLACAAFELLTGAPPFRREQSIAVIHAQLSESPPPLSSRRPDLPAGSDEVMNRALAKRPEDRYPTCGEFAAALRAALAPGLPGSDPCSQQPDRPATEIATPTPGTPPAAMHPPAGGAGITVSAGAGSTADGSREELKPPERPPATRRRRLTAVGAGLAAALAVVTVTVILLLGRGHGGPANPNVNSGIQRSSAAVNPLKECRTDTSTCRLGDRDLSLHASGRDVTELQQRLHYLGFYTAAVDGNFGPVTAAAVTAFQTCVRRAPNGVVGQATVAALHRASPASVAHCLPVTSPPPTTPVSPPPTTPVSPPPTTPVSPPPTTPVSPPPTTPVSPPPTTPVSPPPTTPGPT